MVSVDKMAKLFLPQVREELEDTIIVEMTEEKEVVVIRQLWLIIEEKQAMME